MSIPFTQQDGKHHPRPAERERLEAVSPFVPHFATALHAETASVGKLHDFTEGHPLTVKVLQMTCSEG